MKKFCKFGFLMSAMLTVGMVTLSASSARAQGYCGGGWGGGVNFPYGLYGNRVNDVPYFSMFPPVYYSLPIPRTYGWSPFAYPPGTMTPEIEPESPQDLVNPYVPQNKDQNKDGKPAKQTATRTASYHPAVPQVLVNPYVKSTKLAVTSGQAAMVTE